MSEEGYDNLTPPPFEPDEHGLVVMPVDGVSEENQGEARRMTQESLLDSPHSKKKDEHPKSKSPTLRKTIAISIDSPGTVPDEHVRYPNCPIVEVSGS